METDGTLFKRLIKNYLTSLNEWGRHYQLGHFYKNLDSVSTVGKIKPIKNRRVKQHIKRGYSKRLLFLPAQHSFFQKYLFTFGEAQVLE